MDQKELGMKWCTVYTVLFVIKIIGTTISMMSATNIFFNNNLMSNHTAIAILLLGSSELVFDIVAFIFFRKRTEIGYYLNIVYLFIGVVFASISQIWSGSYNISAILGGMVILWLVWSVPNFIYFKNRKFLFGKNNMNNPSNFQIVNQTNSPAPTAVVNSLKNEQKSELTLPKTPETIPVESLKTLRELYDEGVLTDEEFAEKKKNLLGL